MTLKRKYECDVCKKVIKEGYQQLNMVEILVNWNDTENNRDICHVHNDRDNLCIRKIWEILK